MNEEGLEKNEEKVSQQNREEIHSNVVRAGKRTYFFDVKATRRNDYYLTITESKKRFGRDGKFFYEKHKLFLYKEDFDKFEDSLKEVIEFIREANPQPIDPDAVEEKEAGFDQKKEEAADSKDFTSVEFDDLDESAN
ncbi:MAG: PUR family DNA/RNA-binding protein [Bacteroidales bacterium]|nr:PUR family DNA/RNA-binding protein [Bacteroidales bacterium]